MHGPADVSRSLACWFEYQPARVRRPGHPTLASFDPPQVADQPITHFDEHGLGQEANNLTVLQSMLGYRVVRWGSRVYLIDDESMPRFREAVRQGGEPRNGPFGMFYLRRDDWKKPAQGMPDLP